MSKDMAELTSRLAITAIEQNELYQAAKRDAEEAEAYAASLESDLNAVTEMLQKSRAANVALDDRLEAVEKERDDARKLQAKDFAVIDSSWKRRAEKAEAALDAVDQVLESRIDQWESDDDLRDWVKPAKIIQADVADAILAQIEERGE